MILTFLAEGGVSLHCGEAYKGSDSRFSIDMADDIGNGNKTAVHQSPCHLYAI